MLGNEGKIEKNRILWSWIGIPGAVLSYTMAAF